MDVFARSGVLRGSLVSPPTSTSPSIKTHKRVPSRGTMAPGGCSVANDRKASAAPKGAGSSQFRAGGGSVVPSEAGVAELEVALLQR